MVLSYYDLMNIGDVGNLVKQGGIDALAGKITFPATKQEIVAGVNKLPDIPDSVKQLVQTKLPDGTYGSLDDVKKALHL